MNDPPPDDLPPDAPPQIELGPVRGRRRRRRLASWSALWGGPLGTLSPAAALEVGSAAGLWPVWVDMGVRGFSCFSLFLSLFVGLPAGIGAAIFSRRFVFLPSRGPERTAADFGAAYFAGAAVAAPILTFLLAGGR